MPFLWTETYETDPSTCDTTLMRDCGVIGDCAAFVPYDDLCYPFPGQGGCGCNPQADFCPGPGNYRDLAPYGDGMNWSEPQPPNHIGCEVHLSNEYTTAMLVSNTITALPPYPGTFTGTCSAYRNLSSDETSYNIRRFRYKFTFPAATQPFVIH